MSTNGQRPIGLVLAAILLFCSLSPLIVTEPADARLSGTQPLNGNQELIAHPSMTMIYYGGAGTVTAWNYETDSTYTVDLSDSRVDVSSMDISADGATLAAACEGNIYILSISSDNPTIIKTISSSHARRRTGADRRGRRAPEEEVPPALVGGRLMTFWSSKKVLVTGGAGFLGSFLVEELVRAGASASDITVPRSRETDLRVWENCME